MFRFLMTVAERIAVLESRRIQPALESPIADLPVDVEGRRYCVACGERLVAPVYRHTSTFMHRRCAELRGWGSTSH